MLSFNYRKGESNDLRSTPSRWSMGKMAPKRICNRPMNVFINGRIIALRCLYIEKRKFGGHSRVPPNKEREVQEKMLDIKSEG